MASFRSEARWSLAKRSKFRYDLAMAKYQTGSHTKHRLQYHLVWIPKYRRRVLRGKVAIRLRKLLYEACRMNKWWIRELSIEEDHVHIIIQTKPSDSVAEAVQRLKGGTSRVIRKNIRSSKSSYGETASGRMGILPRQ